MRAGLEEIQELNTTGADENGNRWSHSDLIDQVIIPLLPGKAMEGGDDLNAPS